MTTPTNPLTHAQGKGASIYLTTLPPPKGEGFAGWFTVLCHWTWVSLHPSTEAALTGATLWLWSFQV